MHKFIALAGILVALISNQGLAESKKPFHYSIDDTEIGVLLDDPEAAAILDKHMPGFSKGSEVNLARPFTLGYIVQIEAAQHIVTEKRLEKIQVDFDKLAAERAKTK